MESASIENPAYDIYTSIGVRTGDDPANWVFHHGSCHNTNTLTHAIKAYTTAIETGVTAHWCLCKWRSDPDKVEHCTECNQTTGPNPWREQHPACPMHTKEGLIVGFLTWLATEDARKTHDVLEPLV